MTVVVTLWRGAGGWVRAVLRVAADIGVWVIGTLIVAVVTAGFARADPALPDPGWFNIDLDPAIRLRPDRQKSDSCSGACGVSSTVSASAASESDCAMRSISDTSSFTDALTRFDTG